ncbi:HalOD1 output domain-containing protein [Halosimplex salinum]|uniref:HalOD1 output domain-containing protein n=1 Tax=Halosimplex salinum TaxID=1710538 RepID=UPI0019D07E26|nr:HalOD1 output domain-containing protein [Halosimplex salinum]
MPGRQGPGFVTMSNRTTDGKGGGTDSTQVVYSTAAEREDETDISIAVIEVLAEARGVEPVEMDEPLYDVVDPDALDQLFTGQAETAVGGRVVFELGDHEVTVHADGDILVRTVDSG